ncbi:DNA polymerase alpha catalytic [Niveomyces insectorum RCEF 264]|uniref:DNA polymerase n=1 Tax=Niveomyces insectorum RCEF 264 TaxID=1081102 RepID=A0A167PGS3_9HYPO|nr:DNA polymerase alpha catalytic [Niveomyces insectorum RCEF 264]
MSRVAGRRSKFDKFRALRESGKTAFKSYEVEDTDNLYEEVDENQYKKIVRARLNQDDFVVDDHGEGYADDGREEWDRAHVYESDSEDDRVTRTKDQKTSKKARSDDQADREATDRNIAEYFTKGAAKAQPKSKIIKTEDDDKFLSGLLDEVDANISSVLPRIPLPQRKRSAEQRNKTRDLSPVADTRQPAAKKVKFADVRAPPTPAGDDFFGGDNDDDADFLAAAQDSHAVPASDDVPMSDDPMPSSPTVRVASRKAQPGQKAPAAAVKVEEEDGTNLHSPGGKSRKQDGDDNDDDDDADAMMEVAHAGAVHAASVNLTAARPVKKPLKAPAPYPSPTSSSPVKAAPAEEFVDTSAWTNLNAKLNVVSSPQPEAAGYSGKINYKEAVEEDGSLHFFWTDYTETQGSLCLFGKVLNKTTKKHVSCFVKIDNIMRKLYFLPRKTRFRNGTNASEEEVGMADVYSEVDELMTKLKVQQHKTKVCSRHYAFELPDVPKEGQYLKLLYPYTSPEVGQSSGETYSHVFGTRTALFEQFVLWKNVMGPCWLKIEDGNFDALKNASHCKLEVLVEHPNMVSVLNENIAPEAPPLTLMSLAMRTVYDAATKKQQILAISARIYENVNLTDTRPAEKLPCRTFTVIRPNGSSSFPVGFETLARDKTRHRGFVRAVHQEAEILAFFLAQVALVDPDVIVGHQLEGMDYSVLLDRLRTCKTPQWSRLGRLRRQMWPGAIGRTGGNVFAERQVLSGRLLCDLANDAGRSVMAKCQSWTLTEMCNLYLAGGGSGGGGGENQRRDVDNDAALKTWAKTASGLLDYVAHIEADTYFIAALALRVQILPLTKILTNLAGNSWARTLTGTRAERNEYILLHEFHRNKYICPDKQTVRGRARPEDEDNDNEAGGETKKKDKYKGGLVFEPERGLYDKFVLVMDFNSLYPSIIQEFNICFTTVERSSIRSDEDEDIVPEVPKEQERGILPKLIAGLVSRRRQVKSLMKDKKATPEQLATWDIKQLALKLTANSMYGCLGYTRSRFYARPLAVLVTYKGREILRSTKELAESKSLQVIYGDTDSVMINANVDNVADALRVGQEFKRAVNERYRLLEIDIDNIFRRILLQAKKKYAAINMIEAGDAYVEKMEVKGLDMRRREYCALSKEMSTRILHEILSGDETERSVARIHEYLRETAATMRGGDLTPATGIPVNKYIIYTQLGKEPTDYPNGDTMPQVQVALRDLARGKRVRKGDVVSYIIATGANAPASDPAPKRAYSPGDLLKKDAGLAPDVEWYLGKQIFPPVERLCANIEGTSTAQLAENLGLDVRRYAAQNGNGSSGSGAGNGSGTSDALDIHPLETQIPDAVRFRDCARLQLRCRACKATGVFEGLLAPKDAAPAPAPAAAAGAGAASAGASAAVAESTTTTTTPPTEGGGSGASATPPTTPAPTVTPADEGWLVCDDAACGQRTRQMSVYGTRCLGARGLARGCLGRMRYEVGERDVYNQLVYFAGLFDVDKARQAVQADGPAAVATDNDDDRERVLALAEHNRVRFGTVKATVERYLDKCGRRWVAMDTLFAKLGFAASGGGGGGGLSFGVKK